MNNKTLFTLILTVFTTTAAAEELYGPAVSVNGVDISRAKVMAQTSHLVNARGMGSGGITQPGTYRQIQDEVIEQLVVQELLWQEAKRKNFVVPEEDVDAAMAQAKSSFDSEMAFRFRIEEGGYTEESFRENIRQQKSVQLMLADLAKQEVLVDDKRIESFYKERIGEMVVPGRIRARHILISFDTNDDVARAAAGERLAAVRDALESGMSFALVATEFSEGPSAAKGGDLGFFERGQMVKPFEDVTLDEAAPRIREYLENQGYREFVSSYVERLRSEGDIDMNM
jgi:peptidyl-prolyl cis-trans isomerase C